MKNKKKLGLVLPVVLLLIAIPVVLIGIYGGAAHKASIKSSDFANIFNLSGPPNLPNSWQISSIEKYDDGFTAPSVTIFYKNNVSLTLSRSELIYPKMQKEQISIGDNSVNLYTNKEEQVYVVKYGDLFYAFKFQTPNKNEVEDFIKTLR
ncbi:hypothetical protein [Effusibacillus consociatus]|uniref:DUF4367 domain-containing protein n=1 Tax=Effusibacillus consociatus TaxID=1117041 RepID=A0ABV9PYN3_9BACL